jgi:N-acyl-D-amino-acid deacylase
MKALEDSDDRRRIAAELSSARLSSATLTNFKVPENSKYDGKSILHIAELRGQEPAYALMDLLHQENLGLCTVGPGTNPQTLPAFVSHPAGMIASDAVLFGEFPSPRSYGCFPVVLAEFVRAEKHLSLPEAIRKMTSFPAQRLGLRERGILLEGFKADIVIFDPTTVKAPATMHEPKQFPIGINYVIVNGNIVIDNGNNTGLLPGRALRRGKD